MAQRSTVTWGHAINSMDMLASAIEQQLDMLEVGTLPAMLSRFSQCSFRWMSS